MNCQLCGKEFTRTGPRGIFCNNNCKQKSLYKRHRNKKRPQELLRAKEKYERLKDTPVWQYARYKMGAKVRDYQFNITLDEFILFYGKPCFYCGIENPKNGMDRVDNSIGYEKENLVSCCAWCNKAKWTKPQGEFIEHCKIIAKRF